MEAKPMRILVATDGSRPAHAALDLVGRTAWPRGSTVRIVEVVETETQVSGVWFAAGLAGWDDLESSLLRHAAATVSASERHLAGHHFEVESRVLQGRPSKEINGEARSFAADLVVLGSRGHGTIEAMVLGSVSAEVVAESRVPVLVVRGSTPSLEHVLVASDGSPAAGAALDLLKRWPAFADSSVKVVSVSDPGGPWWAGFPAPGAAESSGLYLAAVEEANEAHAALAREAARDLQTNGIDATAISVVGQPASEIIEIATTWPADAIVMGTRGRHGLSRLLLGSVARNVVLHAHCSVLVVPLPAVTRYEDTDEGVEPVLHGTPLGS